MSAGKVRQAPSGPGPSPSYREMAALFNQYNQAKQLIGSQPAITGFGAYAPVKFQTKYNTLNMGNDPPEVRNKKEGRVVIKHREFLMDVITSSTAGAFNVQNFYINPGLAGTFPWLSAIAQNFEQYKLKGMLWEFKSAANDVLNSTTTPLGTILIVTEYDATRPSFVSKIQMDNHQWSSSAKQSFSIIHPLECSRSQTVAQELYVRSGGLAPGTDQRLYDFANVQVATVGSQAASVNIGELWVEYEFELLKPIQVQPAGELMLADHFKATTGFSTTNWFGTNPVNVATASLGCTLTGTGSTYNTINFPPVISQGEYLITFNLVGTSASVTAPTLTYTNCAALNIFTNDSVSVINDNGTVPNLLMVIAIKITAANAFILFTTSGAIPASPTSMDLFITTLNSNIVS